MEGWKDGRMEGGMGVERIIGERKGELPEEEKVKQRIPFIVPPFATHTHLPHTVRERGQSPPEGWEERREIWEGSEELIVNIETLPLPGDESEMERREEERIKEEERRGIPVFTAKR